MGGAILLASLLVVATAAALAGTAVGQEPSGAAAVQSEPLAGEALEREVRRVAADLRCVVCQGLSLADSRSELALEMKQIIREQLQAGRTAEEIQAYFKGRYGEWILLEPEPRGFNLLVYLLPVAGLLVGGLVVVTAVRRWTSDAEPEASESTPVPAGRDGIFPD